LAKFHFNKFLCPKECGQGLFTHPVYFY